MSRFFPVSQPSIGPRELEYVSDAVKSGWVSSLGRYIVDFENAFARLCGTEYALALSNGTTALHLALVSLGIGPGAEVIIPDLTFVATANAVVYTGARPVPVDIDEDSLCISTDAIAQALTPATRAIIPVHLYGHPAAMGPIMEIARAHNLYVVEDAAEAHGATVSNQRVGGIGDCGVFSFYGNKIMTSGEGGMLTTNNHSLYLQAKLLRDHAMSPEKRYWHTAVGYNYRMTNLQAALGLAQIERIDDFLAHRASLMQWYREELGPAGPSGTRLNRDNPDLRNVYWMVCLEIPTTDEAVRDSMIRRLRAYGVDSRPYFYPISDLPMYRPASTPVAHRISKCGLNLPSYFDLSREDVSIICSTVRRVLDELDLS